MPDITPGRASPLEVWSCDPRDIPPWTDEAKQRLHLALAEVFGWPKVVDDPAQPPVTPPATDKA